MLLNNLNFATSYDFTADSLAWSPMRVSGGTQFFKDKLNLNFGATFDPYAIDNAGKRINTFNKSGNKNKTVNGGCVPGRCRPKSTS
jgi:hypothetical protein